MPDWNHFTPTVSPASYASAMIPLRVEGADPTNPALDTFQQIPVAALVAASAALTTYEAAVAAPTGASLIGFLQAGTGAVARTVQDKLRERISIMDFGAVGDGVADDTAAIMAAIIYANSLGGAEVIFQPGNYLVGSAGAYVSYAFSNIWLGADAPGSATIINGSATQSAITWGNGVTQLYGGGIKGLAFGCKAGVTATAGSGISIQKVGQFRLEDLLISYFPAALFDGLTLSSCSQYQMVHSEVQGVLSLGIQFINCVDSYISNCRSDGNGSTGWYFNGTQGTYAVNCTAYNNGISGWSFFSDNPAVLPNINNFFTVCVGDTSGSYNWNIGDSMNSNWASCWGSTQKSQAVNTSATGFAVSTQYSRNLTFLDCFAEYNNAHGFQLFDSGSNAPSYIYLSGCSFGTQGYLGSNGNGQSGVGYGLWMNGAVNHIRISGGQFENNATGAIFNSSSGNDIIINGNPVGYVTANQGPGTIAIGSNSIVVEHGLSFAPSIYNIHLTDNSSKAASGISSCWVSAPTATTFTVNSNSNVATSPYVFSWMARGMGT